MTNEEAINALTMCQELMLFDPLTGETHELWQENKDNQDLYNACGVAITALREQAERNKGCDGCAESGKWESEFEYGYPCPCLPCSRRCSDGYKPKEAQHE